jgi:hypothetical protein
MYSEYTAFKLEKEHYGKSFEDLYKACYGVLSKYGENLRWGALLNRAMACAKCQGP